MKKFCLLLTAYCLLFSLLPSACSLSSVQDKRILLGTTVEIKAVGQDREELQRKINLAFAGIDRLEKIFDFHNPKSELSRLNKDAAQQSVGVSEDLFFVIKKAVEFSELTDGAFDPTINSPNKEASYKDIGLNEKKRTIFFSREGLKIDLGGCAKGYIVDQVAKGLRESGVSSFLINAGGDIIASGREWKIGIQHPQGRNKILRVLKLRNKAIATSGNYLRKHIINPQSKQVAEDNILSSTIISNSCLKSDILATAVFVLGKNKGLRLIEGLKDAEGTIVVKQEERIETIFSSGFNGGKDEKK